jgi:predicted enzyme related to lactoylglutathione lyase
MTDSVSAGLEHSPAPAVHVGAVVIDVNDLDAQTTFWSALLGSEVVRREPDWVDVAQLGDGGPMLSLQQVPEPKDRKNRLHLDIMVDDFAATSRAAIDGGATTVSPLYEPDSTPWQVLADPEGNEFCLISETASSGA